LKLARSNYKYYSKHDNIYRRMITLGVKPRSCSRHMYDHDKVFKHGTIMTVFKGTHSHGDSQARHGHNTVFKNSHDTVFKAQYSSTQYHNTVFKHKTIMTVFKGTHSNGGSQAGTDITQYSSTQPAMTVFTLSHDSIQARHGHNTVFKYSHDTVFKAQYHGIVFKHTVS
jgi:hypothetical protein